MNAIAPIVPDESLLPVRYEAARKALSECEAIDELKGWSDKAAALAVYAKQANDSSLHMMALRIQARANRRCGELLKQIPPGDTATRFGQPQAISTDSARACETRPPADDGQATLARPSRTQAASDAGLSDYQRRTALRVANVPAESFESQVESDSPPTVAALAAQGVASRPASEPARALASEARSALTAFAKVCERIDARLAGEAIAAQEAIALRRHVRCVDVWLDAFVTRLPNNP